MLVSTEVAKQSPEPYSPKPTDRTAGVTSYQVWLPLKRAPREGSGCHAGCHSNEHREVTAPSKSLTNDVTFGQRVEGRAGFDEVANSFAVTGRYCSLARGITRSVPECAA